MSIATSFRRFFMIFLALIFPILLAMGIFTTSRQAKAAARPLVGTVDYSAWSEGIERAADMTSLTPPVWSYRLPFFASVYNDGSRLTRTSNTPESITYHLDSDIVGFMIYVAFNDADSVDLPNDIKLYISSDNATYTQWQTFTSWSDVVNHGPGAYARAIVGTSNYIKAVYWSYRNIPSGTRYLKIEIAKTNGSNYALPQIMRVEVNTGAPGRLPALNGGYITIADDMNGFSKMYSHTSNLTFDTSNSQNFRLVTGDEANQATVDVEINYLKAAHIDFLTVGWSAFNKIDLLRSHANKADFQYSITLSDSVLPWWTDMINRIVGYFGDSNYVRVVSGRPLVYLLNGGNVSYDNIQQLRNASTNAGRGNPYIVCMQGSVNCDAGGSYNMNGSGSHLAINYAGTSQTIPTVGLWDNDIPRNSSWNPPPWGGGYFSNTEIDPSNWTQSIQAGLQWVADHPGNVPANILLLSSWNEHAESASIEPTLNTDGSANTTVVNIVGAAISNWGNGSGGGTNLLQNPGFETGNLSSWTVWPGPNGTDGNAAYVESGGHTGQYRAVEWKSTNYQVSVYQCVGGLTSGSYTASAWIEAYNASASLSVYDTPGGNRLGTVSIPTTLNWQQISVTVNVTGGQACVAFESQSPANTWIRFDDVVLSSQ